MVANKKGGEKEKVFVASVQKRGGSVVPFDVERIVTAINKAMIQTGEGSEEEARLVANKVLSDLVRIVKKHKNFIPTVEGIQDSTEKELILSEYVKTAKAYILYREKRSKLREKGLHVPEKVKRLATESKRYFRNPLGEFVYYRTYSRWIDAEGRRETWIETVDRYISFMKENLGKSKLKESEYAEIREAILKQEAMPSMRLLQFSGTAARTTNVCAYNCSFIAPESFRDIAEIMYVSMCGTGAGWSVESQNVQKFPQIKLQTGKKLPVHTITDSKEGWCDAFIFGANAWVSGSDVEFDYSQLRPAGARLKVMGGKSSGPEPLRRLLNFAREKMFKRQGKRLSNLDVHDIICMIGDCVVSGGVRRSAMISLSDLDDQEIRDAKKGQFYVNEPQRSLANNSAVYIQKPSNAEFLNEWVALMNSGSGERGIFNRGSLAKTLPERRLKVLKGYFDASGKTLIGSIGTNPCVTGETLVYMADGRGHVPIKQLAEEGKDVPVFCYDDRGKIVIRTMRNPRVTGVGKEVYKVTLDDGSTITATNNHKFRLRTGGYREVKDLKRGDSLAVLTKFEASLKDIFPGANSRSQDYWWLNNGKSRNNAEHRLIASFHYNTLIPKGVVVHHKDRNARNNAPENLEIMSKMAHDALHGNLMTGDNNPMRRAQTEWTAEQWRAYKQKHSENNSGEKNKRYSGVTEDELRKHALALTKNLGRRFSNNDWLDYAKRNNLPQSFSKWRKDHLGGVLGLAKWSALECGFEHVDTDPRVLSSYTRYTKEGYDCEIVDGQIHMNKQCEVCSAPFQASITTREYGVCSISCGLKKKWSDKTFHQETVSKIRKSHDKRKEKRREVQLATYTGLLFSLGRTPLKSEWVTACKKARISPEISRMSSPFRTYHDLQTAAQFFNHRVASVEFVGYENVYNGTVDEFHNFFVGGFVGTTKNGKRKIVYLNNLQCGEIILQSKQFCNLSEVVARREDDEKSLLRKVRVATILGTYQSTLTNFPYLSKEWKEHCDAERLLGVSITGQWDCPAVRDAEVLKKMKKESIRVNQIYAKRFGVNASTCITCVKPSGTLSQTVDCSSGMHPRHAPYYIRRIRISATDTLFKMLKDQGVPYHPEVGQPAESAMTYVLEFPVKAPGGSIYKNDLTALEQLVHWKLLKENFTEHNPSVTVSVGDNEWIAVANWLYEHWDIIGGLSFLPRDNHVYQLAPYQEIDEKTYHEMARRLAHIDFSKIITYEKQDDTEVKKEMACVAGVCEIV